MYDKGRSKPWQQNRSSLFDTVELSSNNQNSHTEQWYRALKIAQLQTGIVLNFDFAKGEIDKAPPVGRFSDYGQMIKHIRVRASQNWTAYERGESAQTFSPPKPRKALRLSRSTPRKSSNLREGPLEQNEMLDVSTNVKGKGSSSSMSPTILPVVNSESLQGHPTRKWAYAFLVGGCSSKNLEYRGFLYNAVAAAQRLKMMGSKADVVVLLQMSVKSKETRLPEDEERLLTAMGIKFQYLPKFNHEVHEVFYALVKEKFRILDLTDYSRVLFIDADIMPLCSLDYLFELSEPEDGPGILKENVVIGWRREAANAGFFMLKPNREDYLDLQEVILRKEQKALDLSWPHWDEVEGWGHRIVAPDFWRAPDGGTGTNWTWHAVFADQGLLYHWTKYVKQSVSLIIGKQVENWGSRNGTAYLEGTQKEVLSKFTCIPPLRGGRYMAPSPYQDFRHFTGKKCVL